MTSSLGQWDYIPSDVQKEIFKRLHADKQRHIICHLRNTCKQFCESLENIQVTASDDRYSVCQNFSKISQENTFQVAIEWLIKHAGVDAFIMIHAAEVASTKGFTHVLAWMDKNNMEVCFYPRLMNFAARGGKLNTLRWLYDKKPWTYSFFILSECVTSGSLEILEWVLDNLGFEYENEGKHLLRKIVTSGHEHMVKHLIHRKPEWINECINTCLSSDRTHLLQWVHARSPDYTFSEKTLFAAAELHISKDTVEYVYNTQFKGNLGILTQLIQIYKKRLDNAGIHTYNAITSEDTLAWLESTLKREKVTMGTLIYSH